jgi:hypothetical protein
MNVLVVAATGISVLVVLFFLAERQSLRNAHARGRTQLTNAARWASVIVLAWSLIPLDSSQSGPQRVPTILGLVALIGALVLVPVRWFVRLGGREPTWELRRAKIAITQLANKVRRDPASVDPLMVEDAITRIKFLRTFETAELCDLIVAELEDFLRGAESWNEAGRRTIRIDELSRRFWPGAMPPPDHDPVEATFRWKMYRTFGELMQVGVSDISPASRDEFWRLLGALDAFRRLDTEAFIDDAQRSASDWLDQPWSDWAWIDTLDFWPLGPNGPDEIKCLWGRDADLWGAVLDDADRRAIAADLAERAQPVGSRPTESQSTRAQLQGGLR